MEKETNQTTEESNEKKAKSTTTTENNEMIELEKERERERARPLYARGSIITISDSTKKHVARGHSIH